MSNRISKLHPNRIVDSSVTDHPENPTPRRKYISCRAHRALTTALLLATATLLTPHLSLAQASGLPSAAPPIPAGQTDTQRGHQLIDQMIAALGGQAWLDRSTLQLDVRAASFFHGQPNPYIILYREQRRLTQPEAARLGFLTSRGVLLPGKKIDVVQIWTAGNGYEITYKGKTTLPKDQVEDYYRNRAHSIEEVVHNWLKAPGVITVAEGTTMVERRLADKVTVLSASNDAVTFELDAATHLPLRQTFHWRNVQFNDFDEDAETYDDYHTIQGLPTPLTVTRYHNGEIVSQRFFSNVIYNAPLDSSLFDPAAALQKK